jgi:hypothetical protein
MPDVDVAAAGGWVGLTSLKRAYQQADQGTMLQVAQGAGEFRVLAVADATASHRGSHPRPGKIAVDWSSRDVAQSGSAPEWG